MLAICIRILVGLTLVVSAPAYGQRSSVFSKPVLAVYPFRSMLTINQGVADKPVSAINGRRTSGAIARPKAGAKKIVLGSNLANTIRGEVEAAFVASKRFKIVERSRIDQLVQEMKLEETLSDQQVNKLGQTLGAQFIVTGALTQSVQKATRKPGVGLTGYTQLHVFEVRAVRISTSEVLAAESISVSAEGDTQAEAAERALQEVRKEAQAFIGKHYPVEYQLIAITEEKNDEARTIEMVGPTQNLPDRRQQLEVFQLNEVVAEGRKFIRRTPIGIVKFEQAQGDILVCEVSRGGEKIKAAFDSKAVLILRLKAD